MEVWTFKWYSPFINKDLLYSTGNSIQHSITTGSMVKNLPVNAGDSSWIPEWGTFSGVGNGNSLQYSCLEKPMDRGAWQATVHGITKSWTWLSHKYTCSGAQNCNYWARPRAQAQQQEKPLQWEAYVLQLESSPHSLQLEKSLRSNEDPAQSKINFLKLFFKIYKKIFCNNLYGKRISKRMDICICTTEQSVYVHFAVQLKWTQHCKSVIHQYTN